MSVTVTLRLITTAYVPFVVVAVVRVVLSQLRDHSIRVHSTAHADAAQSAHTREAAVRAAAALSLRLAQRGLALLLDVPRHEDRQLAKRILLDHIW